MCPHEQWRVIRITLYYFTVTYYVWRSKFTSDLGTIISRIVLSRKSFKQVGDPGDGRQGQANDKEGRS